MLEFILMSLVTNAAFDPATPRGEAVVPHGSSEICVIPKRLGDADYSKKDRDNEIGLCAIEIQGTGANTAACGKVHSTNPAVEFFSVPSGISPADFEKQHCVLKADLKNEVKKLAKYKVSTSCSYTPSILAYYHVSRFLGDINNVPVAVLRSMEKQRHISIGEDTLKHLSSLKKDQSMIALTWKSLLGFLTKGAESKRRVQLMSTDFKHTYGALQKNPTKEAFYKEMFYAGDDQPKRTKNFKNKSPIFALLKDARALPNLVDKTWSAQNVQTVLQMKNVSDLVLLDTILSQEDRFGNLHYIEVFYFLENGDLKHSKKLSPEEIKLLTAVKVREMVMKDNDCGVNRANHLKDAGLLLELSHFNPETYHRLLKLKELLNSKVADAFFLDEILMTAKDLQLFKDNVNFAATSLQGACRAQKLKLDLDLGAHFGNEATNMSCD